LLLKNYKDHFISVLTFDYGLEEATSFFYLLSEHLHGLRRVDLVLQPDFSLTPEDVVVWSGFLEKLQEHHPIQYLLGSTHFYGLPFHVTPAVLVPRPETEELVDWVVQSYSMRQPKSILDIGTGSGCIAISLAHHFLTTQVYAMDVSSGALEVAQLNASLNHVSVHFLQQDILKTLELPTTYEVIISNPPYVRVKEKQEIKPNVLNFEPHLALFVSDEDPLLFYSVIAELAQKSLQPGGYLFFEINQYLGEATVNLLKDLGFKDIELRKDFMGNDRMIRATLF
jgi:release factor glutamine methyltransferase